MSLLHLSLLLLLLHHPLLLPALTHSSCTPYNFSCGNHTLQIQPPFFSNLGNPNCKPLLHEIQCMNLVPVIKLHNQPFIYPVSNLSYRPHRTLIIHDLKLSSYFRLSKCAFLYDFTSPIPRFNVSNLTENVSSSQWFIDCEEAGSYDFGHDVFDRLLNLKSCDSYSVYYSHDWDGDGSKSYCSGWSDAWFDWGLSFDEDEGFVSLMSAGFSRRWTGFPDCFGCRIASGSCSNECRGIKPSGDGDRSKKIVIGVLCVLGVLLISCSICIICCIRKLKQCPPSSSTLLARNTSSKQFSKEDLESICFHCETHVFSYEELDEATDGFDASMELGDGGYGTVYKGVLKDGRTVAVKRLYETTYKRVEQFVNEVEILSRLRHPNLVALYGSTSPTSPHLLLVYEFIPNGTLADHLHNPLLSKSLPLSLRLSIAIETALALSYLHSNAIIHRDVKSHNILLGQNFNAKVADFGLSRLFPSNATHVSTAPQGTPGYLDPEYHRFYQLTDKSDVYSFGVVIMELISSRPAVDIGRKPNKISLAMDSVSKIQKGRLDQLADRGFGFDTDEEAKRIVSQMGELAFRCLQMEREMRPCMKEVLEELREIEKGVYCNVEECVVEMKKNNSELLSPNSVMSDWVSRSTTSGTMEHAMT